MTDPYKTLIRDLCDELSAYDYGDGCLSIIVRTAVEDGITDPEEIAEICREAEEDERIERARR